MSPGPAHPARAWRLLGRLRLAAPAGRRHRAAPAGRSGLSTPAGRQRPKTPAGRQRLAAVCAAVLASALLPAGAAAQSTALGPPQTIAGPGLLSPALGGMSIARDGSGGLVYISGGPGAGHVYVSRLVGGVFQAPQQLDSGLSGASTQAVIAAGNGGVLLVAFINSGELYVDDQTSTAAGWGSPQPLYAGASAPAISMSNFGKAYLAFAAAENGGSDVRAAYYSAGSWSLVSAPLNATIGDDAGTGAGPPSVVAAGDGLGIVAWGESGHVYARRVWGQSPSTLIQRADPATFAGGTEVTADSPQVSAGGDSSYVDVAYREQLNGGGTTQTRVLLTRLIAETVGSTTAVDGVGTGGQSADQPAVAMNEYGRGFATAAVGGTASSTLSAATLGTNGAPGAVNQIGAGAPNQEPYAVPALAGIVSTLVAFQGAAADGTPQIELRYAGDGVDLGAPLTVSSPAQGPTQATDGLAAGGDNEGDAAVAWVQGAPGVQSIDAAQLYVPPGQVTPATRMAYSRTSQPTLSWTAAREEWGVLTYTVTVDGNALGQTTGTSIAAPAPLNDGPHVWQVTAVNPAGEQSTSSPATVFVDTVAPRLRISLTGRRRRHHRLTLRISAADVPPAQPGARASGISSVTVRWGDGTPLAHVGRHSRLRHAYARARVYRLTVQATDAAGNRTTISRYLRVLR